MNRRYLLLAGTAALGLVFLGPIITNFTKANVFDLIDYPIHEAGHYLFVGWTPFLFSTVMGGVFQVGVPLVMALLGFLTKSPLVTVFGLMWAGEALSYTSQYVLGAQGLTIATRPVKNFFHDWVVILDLTGNLGHVKAVSWYFRIASWLAYAGGLAYGVRAAFKTTMNAARHEDMAEPSIRLPGDEE